MENNIFDKLKENQLSFTIHCISYMKDIINSSISYKKKNDIIYLSELITFIDNTLRIKNKDNSIYIKIYPVNNNMSAFNIKVVEKINDQNIKYELELSPYIPILEIYLNLTNNGLFDKLIFHSLTSITDIYTNENYKNTIYNFFYYIKDLYTKYKENN